MHGHSGPSHQHGLLGCCCCCCCCRHPLSYNPVHAAGGESGHSCHAMTHYHNTSTCCCCRATQDTLQSFTLPADPAKYSTPLGMTRCSAGMGAQSRGLHHAEPSASCCKHVLEVTQTTACNTPTAAVRKSLHCPTQRPLCRLPLLLLLLRYLLLLLLCVQCSSCLLLPKVD